MTNRKTKYKFHPLTFPNSHRETKHTLLVQKVNMIGTPLKTYDNETRAVGKQICHLNCDITFRIQ